MLVKVAFVILAGHIDPPWGWGGDAFQLAIIQTLLGSKRRVSA